MTEELGLMDDEPASIIDNAIHGLSIRKQQVTGLCRRIGIIVDGEKLEGYVEDRGWITRAWSIARDCYIVGLFEASALFSSIAVECAINRDARMKDAKKRLNKNWLMLNQTTLNEIEKQKFPIKDIIMRNESNLNNIFVITRNKIAHGDFEIFSKEILGDLSRVNKFVRKPVVDISDIEALAQFKKCSAFLESWVNQKPKLMDIEIIDV